MFCLCLSVSVSDLQDVDVLSVPGPGGVPAGLVPHPDLDCVCRGASTHAGTLGELQVVHAGVSNLPAPPPGVP